MSSPQTIAFFGSSLVSSYWNGAATYYRGIIRALAERGHIVTFFEPDAFQRQAHRDMDDPDWARVVVYPGDVSGTLRALEYAAGNDVVVKASGVGVNDELLEREVLAHSDAGTVVFWDVDAPATLQRLRDQPDDPFCELIPQYDLILTYGGGQRVVDEYRSFGAACCVPIYNGVDPDIHHPVGGDERFVGSLGFLANRMPDREARVHDFFFAAASKLPAEQFLLGGSGWEENVPALRNVTYVGHVFSRDHNAFNCTPTAVLNVNRQCMASYGYSPATRIFEAAGAGACIISDCWPGIETFLEPGREVLLADDGQDVADHLQRLSPDQFRTIGSRARRRVLAEHTYNHRARQIEGVLEGRISTTPA